MPTLGPRGAHGASKNYNTLNLEKRKMQALRNKTRNAGVNKNKKEYPVTKRTLKGGKSRKTRKC